MLLFEPLLLLLLLSLIIIIIMMMNMDDNALFAGLIFYRRNQKSTMDMKEKIAPWSLICEPLWTLPPIEHSLARLPIIFWAWLNFKSDVIFIAIYMRFTLDDDDNGCDDDGGVLSATQWTKLSENHFSLAITLLAFSRRVAAAAALINFQFNVSRNDLLIAEIPFFICARGSCLR